MLRATLLLLLAVRLEAATEYRVAFELTGNPLYRANGPSVYTVLVDGAHQRVLDEGRGGFLSNDGGKTKIHLDPKLKTWWTSEESAIFGRLLPTLLLPMMTKATARDVRVVSSDEPSDEMFADLPTHKYVVRATYTLATKIDGSPLSADFGLTIFLWTNETLDPATAVPAVDLTTGVPPVDGQLAPKIAAVRGFPLKTVLIATRAYAGGKPQVSTLTATVSDIRSVTPPPGAFDRPRDYVNQAPIVGAPGAPHP
ncbi:MAG: hypothetical protein AABO58_21245 [Acidobacteriota bacterium]